MEFLKSARSECTSSKSSVCLLDIDLKGFLKCLASTHIGHFNFVSSLIEGIKFIFLSLLIEPKFKCPNLPCQRSRDSTI